MPTEVGRKVAELRTLLKQHANAEHAAFHKNYQKSSKKFYGIKTPVLNAAVNDVFPKRPKMTKEEMWPFIDTLWNSEWFEEQGAALLLLDRIAKELTPADLPHLKIMVGDCEGWAMLDWISTRALGVMAMNYPEEIYTKVRTWTRSKHLWTRRASILIHVMPARKKQLRADVALSTFAELLHEKEFFIRKAIGWALREMCKHYPEMTLEFLKEHKAEASVLTMREGSRNLPENLKKRLLED